MCVCVCVSVEKMAVFSKLDNINSHINVKFYYPLNETTPGFVAKTILEL